MSELRYDPVHEQYVVYAPDRLKRPHAFRSSTDQTSAIGVGMENPFAVGNELKTPGEVFAIRQPGTGVDTSGWKVRVFPNLYPAFREDSSQSLGISHDLFLNQKATGGHEVIVETPEEKKSMSDFMGEEWVHYFLAIQNRFSYWGNKPGIQSVYLFKNNGGVAGASLPHAHSQLVAMPVVPPRFEKQIQFEKNYFLKNQKSFSQELLDQELQSDLRVICKNQSFLAFCPYVSRFPYEVAVYPRKPILNFTDLNPAELQELGDCMKEVFRGLERATRPHFPYNLFLRQGFSEGAAWGMRWSLEIFPRVGGIAGFEMGTGMWMNSVLPETAARQMKAVICGS